MKKRAEQYAWLSPCQTVLKRIEGRFGFGSKEFASPQNPACWSAYQRHSKMFHLGNLKVSQQQNHLADNFQAEVIISVSDP